MKMTRRKLAAAITLSAASAAAPLLAQTAPAPPRAPQAPTPDEELKAARDRLQANGEKLAQRSVPMPVQPAFQFRA